MDPVNVRFLSDDAFCEGLFFLPENKVQVPCAVLANGTGSTYDRLIPHAKRLSADGIAALIFDYRHYGQSGGRPRQLVWVPRQLADLRNALAFAESYHAVDPERVALWGVSLGGGLVAQIASKTPTLSAVVLQVPFNGFPRKAPNRSTFRSMLFLYDMLIDFVLGQIGLAGIPMKLVGSAGERAAIINPEMEKHLLEIARSGSRMENTILPRSFLSLMNFKPSRVADKIIAPVLLSLAEFDTETPLEYSMEIANRAANALALTYPISHSEVYRSETRDRLLDDQILFLHRCFSRR